MIIIPAVDIKCGRCVRLLRGRAEDETVYFDNPLDAALKWIKGGAELIHVVDLDGAFSGQMTNTAHIEEIARRSGTVRIEAGGGIRTEDDIQRLLDAGVDRVVVGTVAAESIERLTELCEYFPGRIAVGIDASRDKVAIKGWTSTTDIALEDFVREVDRIGPAAIIYTDISRDGAMVGPNIERTRQVCAMTKVPVVASGGVASLEDIRQLSTLPLEGVIVGKALFEKTFTLPEAIDAAGNCGELSDGLDDASIAAGGG